MPVRPRRPVPLTRYPERPEPFAPRLHEPPSGEQPGEPPAGIDPHLAGILAPRSFEADQYRVLVHFLEGLRGTTGLKALGITSPVAGDGKTTTAINLAVTLAQSSGTRVLLVDADLRRPNVAARLGLSLDGPGLAAAALDERAELGAVVRKAHGVAVLAAGAAAASPYAALESERVARLLAEARDSYDYIVLDTPPVMLVPDWKAIAQWVDGFLVVVAAHRTPRKILGETLNAMEPSKVLGIVFNGDARSLSGYYKRYAARYYDERPPGVGRGGWRSWLGLR
jgi:capsular exopolysaccharide synthesis family protein